MTAGLRPMNERDLPMVLSWRNADDVRNNMYTNHVISGQEHQIWWDTQQADPATRLLIFEYDGESTGVVTFTRYTGKDGTASWAFYSGDRNRRGVGSMMERAALEYAFETLQVNKLECEVLSFNRPVVDFHLKHGFSIEGVFRQAYRRDNAYFDIYRLAVLADEWNRHIKPALTAAAAGHTGFVGHELVSLLDLSEARVFAYAEATGDRNPVHLDTDYAKSQGFPGRIAHGMLVGSELSRIFAEEFPGPGAIYISQSLEFKAPLLVGNSAEIRLKVISQIGRRLQVRTEVFQNDKLCTAGLAVLLIPKDSARTGSHTTSEQGT